MTSRDSIHVLRIIGECKAGGTETIAMNYYKHINHEKIKMDFLFYGESSPEFCKTLSMYGDKVINVTDYTKNLISSTLEIKNVIKNGNYDIIHSQLNTLNFFPLLGAKLGGAKIRIAANHSTANLRYETKKSIVKYILRPTVKLFATHYVACSSFAGIWCFGKRAYDKGKVKILNNAIDLSKYIFDMNKRNNIRRKMEWEDYFVIGHVGRFTEQKNHKFVIEIFNEVQKIIPKTLLVLIGDGHLKLNVEKQVENLGLENKVKFLGVVHNVNELMQGMDILLFPSLYEGFGNVITEAQAVALHSVVSDVIPDEVKMTEYVDFISLKSNAQEWCDAVLKYYGGYKRRSTYDDLVKAGFEINSAAQDLERYYESINSNSV